MNSADVAGKLNSEPSGTPQYWSKPAGELFHTLNTSQDGLSNAEAAARLRKYGPNLLHTGHQISPFMLFLSQFKSPIMLILIFATLLSAFLQDWPDAIIILFIIFGSAILSFYQEYNAHNAADKLRQQIIVKTTVFREGAERSIPAEQLVPGDVVQISGGNLVPADGVVLASNDMFINQAALTGETFPVEKQPGVLPPTVSLTERTNMVFMGTNVSSGSARILIVQTGLSTSFGQIAAHLVLRPPETEFERGIRQFGYLLTELMLILVIGIFAVNVFFKKDVIDSLLFSVALAVGLTPQLLPAIININLSKGSQVMGKLGVIVRRLESLENFGSMDVLCTDKTGTLTLGVVKMDNAMDVQGQPSDEVFRDAYLNAHFQTGMSNPLDQAILDHQELDVTGIEKIDEIPYEFIRKKLTVVVRENGQDRMLTKGAFENILSVCTFIQDGTANSPLNDERMAALRNNYQKWSEQGFRVLGIASKPVEKGKATFSREDEAGMTFAGFLQFFDPPKVDILKTINELETLGVELKVITGDNRLVARHIADAIGLKVTGVITGDQLDDMRSSGLLYAVQHSNIFSEVNPAQKERIILALKKAGRVVGYMGDGINDAPSLHSADVGISVENAVDVAKEAADFVLLKNDLEVLRLGILQGRKTFANTLKYVFMATSANFGNMFSVAVASLFLSFLPMLPKQILLINFLTDLPEMTIAGDHVDNAFIQRPHRWDVGFIRRFMLIFGPLSSIFDLFTFAVLIYVVHADQALFHTGWFIESVLSASVVVFAIRTRLPLLKSQPSRSMLLVTLIVGIVAILLPYSPLAGVLGFTPPGLQVLGIIVGIIILYFISAEMVKHWFYKHYANY